MAESEKAKKDRINDVLSLENSYKCYELEDADTLFEDIRQAIEENGKKSPNEIATGFGAAAAAIGTHGPKLINPRSPDKPFTPENTEPEFQKHYSGDGKYGRYAKALLRPISIVGQIGNENFIERLGGQINSAVILENAFKKIFGPKALDAVKSGLKQQKDNIDNATAYHENYPMVFVPGPDQDLILTPLSAFSTLSIMWSVKEDGHMALQKARDTGSADSSIRTVGEPDDEIALGRYHRTEISDKPQNTGIGIPKHRCRFFAQMPEVLEQREADIYSWTRGGKVPRMRDRDISERLERYAELLKVVQEQTLAPSAMTKIDQLADWLITDAYQFIDDITAEAGSDAPERPRPAEVLARVQVSFDKLTARQNALRSAHFQHRVTQFKVD